MTINSAALFNAVNQKNIAEVNFALKTAIKDAQDIIQKNYKNEFDLIKWSNLPGNNADDIVLKARLRNAMNALDTTVKLNNFTCSIANLVACYLLYDDKYIKSETKSEWISILLDMIIIGCNYHIKNSNDRSIIECLTAYQSIEAEIEKAQLAAKATNAT